MDHVPIVAIAGRFAIRPDYGSRLGDDYGPVSGP
jgi:hypothetical protein